MSNEIKYEVIDKNTGNVYPVLEYVEPVNSGKVAVRTEFGTVEFDNHLQDGNWTNEQYLIREVGTHNEPDGEGKVEIGTPTE